MIYAVLCWWLPNEELINAAVADKLLTDCNWGRVTITCLERSEGEPREGVAGALIESERECFY